MNRTLLIARVAGAALLLAAAGILALPLPAVSQLLDEESTDPVVIGGQLRAAVELGQASIQRLTASDAPQGLDVTMKVMNEMYAQVRLAVAGLEDVRRATRSWDPLADYRLTRTREAWDELRHVLDRSIFSREDYIASAIPDVRRVIAILEEVLVVMP